MLKEKSTRCPFCGSGRSRVAATESSKLSKADRQTFTGVGFWRKRRCLDCEEDFTTEEVVTTKPAADELPRKYPHI